MRHKMNSSPEWFLLLKFEDRLIFSHSIETKQANIYSENQVPHSEQNQFD